ncbi:MAG: hypothetical protein ACOC32_02165 [Nanoarchaeota archaeon]
MNDRLKDWTIHFLEHKNIFFKNLKGIEDTEQGFIAHFNDKDEEYIIQDNLYLADIPKDRPICYVTLNNQKNFTKLLSEWKILISFPKVKIVFVEKISNGKHWTIHPHMHDKISDKGSLKSGLKSLYDGAKND